MQWRMLTDRPTKGKKNRKKKEIALKFSQIILTNNFFLQLQFLEKIKITKAS